MFRSFRLAVTVCAALVAVPALAQTKMKLGLTKTVTIGGVLYAAEKGWFKEVGLDVDVQFLDASASAMVMATVTPLPAASPSALMTTGAPNFVSAASPSASLVTRW